MAFDWQQYLVIADEIAKDSREAMQRSSISRAYYAVYHLGLKYARAHNFSEKIPSLHRKLWSWYQNQPNAQMRELGTAGSRLKQRREKVDYDDHVPRLPDELRSSLQLAHEFEEKLPERKFP
jgi:uncharacterized protein (UPF0332 family)